MASAAPRIDQLEQNLAINGDFEIWQRGVILTAPSFTTKYLADRFQCEADAAGAGSFTFAQVADVPTVAQSQYASVYSLRATTPTSVPTVAIGYQNNIAYKVEGLDFKRLHQRRGRYQFWAKASVPGAFPLAFFNSALNRSYVTTYTLTAANTWQKFFVDLQHDLAGTWSLDNSAGITVCWTIDAGTALRTSTLNAWQSGYFLAPTSYTNYSTNVSATLQISQFGIFAQDFTQAGAVNADIPFQRCGRNFGEELAKALRYYEVNNQPVGSFFCNGLVQTSTAAIFVHYFAEKRVNPTLSFSGPSAYNVYYTNASSNVTAIAQSGSSGSTKSAVVAVNTAAGMTPGQACALQANSSPSIFIDAEL